MVEETFAPGMTVSLVARQHGVAPNQLFTWRRLVGARQPECSRQRREMVAASDYGALQNQVRELHRLFGKKTLEGRDPQLRVCATFHRGGAEFTSQVPLLLILKTEAKRPSYSHCPLL
jgi:transposase-like protein